MSKTLNDLELELRGVVRGERTPSPRPPEPDRGLLPLLAANLDLLRVIAQERPGSVSALAERIGRAQSNVSRSLQALARFGLVRLVREGKTIRPELVACHVDVDVANGSCHVVEEPAAAE
ncbi:MAG: helix-turn-helix domain-containing protein [Alphaproteobacteria bacterium]|nr:helix-turn-helix domain-containing protein [Alphaproteobacteria bacterium]